MHKAKYGVKQLLTLSIRLDKRQFMTKEQLDFNSMSHFEHELENEPVIEQYFGSEFDPIAHAQRGAR